MLACFSIPFDACGNRARLAPHRLVTRMNGVVEIDAGQDCKHVGLQERDQQFERSQCDGQRQRQDTAALSVLAVPAAAAPYRASGLVLWHFSDVTAGLRNVCCCEDAMGRATRAWHLRRCSTATKELPHVATTLSF